MIASVRGQVLAVGANWAIVEVNQIGYQLSCPAETTINLRVGQECFLHTSLVVREDSLTLYGFAEKQTKESFELVQQASGVGPKIALAIVSVLTTDQLVNAIANDDIATLTKVPGIGKKGAEKIIIELRDKVQAVGEELTTSHAGPQAWREHVRSGLQNLGWNNKQADAACDKVADLVAADPDISLAILMKAALQSLRN